MPLVLSTGAWVSARYTEANALQVYAFVVLFALIGFCSIPYIAFAFRYLRRKRLRLDVAATGVKLPIRWERNPTNQEVIAVIHSVLLTNTTGKSVFLWPELRILCRDGHWVQGEPVERESPLPIEVGDGKSQRVALVFRFTGADLGHLGSGLHIIWQRGAQITVRDLQELTSVTRTLTWGEAAS